MVFLTSCSWFLQRNLRKSWNVIVNSIINGILSWINIIRAWKLGNLFSFQSLHYSKFFFFKILLSLPIFEIFHPENYCNVSSLKNLYKKELRRSVITFVICTILSFVHKERIENYINNSRATRFYFIFGNPVPRRVKTLYI